VYFPCNKRGFSRRTLTYFYFFLNFFHFSCYSIFLRFFEGLNTYGVDLICMYVLSGPVARWLNNMAVRSSNRTLFEMCVAVYLIGLCGSSHVGKC
jgi:hypothetical protein